MKIKTGDKVVITRGKSRGKTGKVTVALPKEYKIVVGGANLHKKHRKPRREREKGQIVHVPFPIPVGNAKIICPACGKAARIGYKFDEKGEKQRVCKKCDKPIK
ncbi:MAG: 50S ribosomal protein L24 [Candidatus Spechtbacteria bacterium RIFCSPLOWO2_01_FULL_46_10]|uniref:Large ribosomal subunit protein uL24 n=1 Tax=Candidatus Spechtbacteria bacterium RIFCSPLOWO2_01_FULL_46_10 TaxID=1802163 RepID=A0A1G2HFQ2_9BACT|nr:MAG: 50S ribosomal protein L24 [Candidatus Spechtbacteria bacterium RIFCSPLOWO2_01_FULL_46_10]